MNQVRPIAPKKCPAWRDGKCECNGFMECRESQCKLPEGVIDWPLPLLPHYKHEAELINDAVPISFHDNDKAWHAVGNVKPPAELLCQAMAKVAELDKAQCAQEDCDLLDAAWSHINKIASILGLDDSYEMGDVIAEVKKAVDYINSIKETPMATTKKTSQTVEQRLTAIEARLGNGEEVMATLNKSVGDAKTMRSQVVTAADVTSETKAALKKLEQRVAGVEAFVKLKANDSSTGWLPSLRDLFFGESNRVVELCEEDRKMLRDLLE